MGGAGQRSRVAVAATDTEWHSLDAAEMRAGRELDSAGSISGQSRLVAGKASAYGIATMRKRVKTGFEMSGGYMGYMGVYGGIWGYSGVYGGICNMGLCL